jgi:uncharacterized membrane protein
MFVEIKEDSESADQVLETGEQPTSKLSLSASLYAKVSDLILQYHLHPIAVHTPNGIVPMAILFLFITTLLGYPFFETAAFYSLVFVLIIMPVVLLTGYETWQRRYRGALTSIFKIKIGASLVTVFLLLTLIIWRAVQPEIVTTPSSGRWIYLSLSGILLVAVGLAGHMGGKLVFGNRKN